MRIGDFLTESNIETPLPSAERRIRVKLNAEGIEKRPLLSETEGATRYYTRKVGQFIYGKQNLHKGAFGVIHREIDGFESSSDLPAFDVGPGLRPEWLDYFLKQGCFYKSLTTIARGAATKRIQPRDFLALPLPVPSLEVQDKLIHRMATASDKCSEISAEIARQETLLGQLKQAILQEAIEGKLTAGWRAAHPQTEPASALLRRIQAEKARLIAAKQLRPEKPLPKIQEAEFPFAIPAGWEWCRLGDTIEEKPRNGISLKPVDYETNAKTLKLSATSSGTFDGSQTKFLDLNVEPDSYLWLRDGDILIQRANSLELVGTAAVYRGADSEFIYPDLMMKCRAVFAESTDYLHHVLSTKITRDYFKGKASGSAGNMPKVNQDTVTNTPIPLPPLAEQAAIVERVEELMVRCRGLEAEIEQARAHAAHLLQAVLREAFAPAR
jgi:type I restriction enzyme S subunit